MNKKVVSIIMSATFAFAGVFGYLNVNAEPAKAGYCYYTTIPGHWDYPESGGKVWVPAEEVLICT